MEREWNVNFCILKYFQYDLQQRLSCFCKSLLQTRKPFNVIFFVLLAKRRSKYNLGYNDLVSYNDLAKHLCKGYQCHNRQSHNFHPRLWMLHLGSAP
jgi:hypothetical protein